ncbi:MAG: restriction endonuclease subunit S [Candidatus Dadabacteria bacterium]|nr:restriction endonuclease subunit S [Candidatus Dadabacteria bacterium]
MKSMRKRERRSESTLKPYPAYKDSGVEWLGKVPEHWEVQKLRTVLRDHTKRNRPDLQLLSVVREKGVIVRDISNQDENHNFIPDDLTNYKVVKTGQFVMNKMKAWQGSYGVSYHDGIVSPAYFVFDLDGVFDDFFNIAIRSKTYVAFFTQASDGVRTGQWDLSQARMRDISVALPPLSEQTSIVRYLDYVNRRVQRLVSMKQKMIALLTEQKQVIISRAVTRGLNPYVSLKDSGIEWLGEVPEHWEVQKLRTVLRDHTKRNRPDLQLLSVVREKGVIVRDISNQDENHNFIPDDLTNYKVVKTGQFVMNKMKAWQGSYGVSYHDGIVSPAYFVFDLDGVFDDFFNIAIRSKAYVAFFTQASDGVRIGQWDLSQARMRNISVALPPLHEQTAIVEHIEKATAATDAAITRAKREIELLNEYQTRLTTDVATGKLDVRKAAEALPEIDPLENAVNTPEPEDTFYTDAADNGE